MPAAWPRWWKNGLDRFRSRPPAMAETGNMKKFFTWLFFLPLVGLSVADVAFSAPGRTQRSAAGSGSARSAVSGGGSGAGGKARSGAPGGGGSVKKVSRNSSSAAEAEPGALGPGETCLLGRIQSVLESDCAYLMPEAVKGALDTEKKPFYCVFSYKDSGKTQSASNLFLQNFYNLSEDSLGSSGAVTQIRDSAEGAGLYKYYEYIERELSAGTLSEGMVLDSLTDHALSGSAGQTGMSAEDKKRIKKKHVESVGMSVGLVEADVEKCRKSAKSVMIDECKTLGNMNAKKLVGDSCGEYESVLQKLAGDMKMRVYSNAGSIRLVLLKRNQDSLAEAAAKQKYDEDKAKLLRDTSASSLALALEEPKARRLEAALRAAPLKAEVADLSGSRKNSRQKDLDKILAEICRYDRTIKGLDSEYKADDCLAKCSDGRPSGAEPEGCVAEVAAAPDENLPVCTAGQYLYDPANPDRDYGAAPASTSTAASSGNSCPANQKQGTPCGAYTEAECKEASSAANKVYWDAAAPASCKICAAANTYTAKTATAAATCAAPAS